jgi:hypothetical protein
MTIAFAFAALSFAFTRFRTTFVALASVSNSIKNILAKHKWKQEQECQR